MIVDNLMNLELLFWASKHGGDPAWYAIARSHALRTIRDHVRPDGSTFHVVDYSPGVWRGGAEEHAAGARAQLDVVARTGVGGLRVHDGLPGDGRSARLLDAARRISDWIIDHLPADRVPYWEFRRPGDPRRARDSSAAAIAASGLLELAAFEPDTGRAAGYRGAANRLSRRSRRPHTWRPREPARRSCSTGPRTSRGGTSTPASRSGTTTSSRRSRATSLRRDLPTNPRSRSGVCLAPTDCESRSRPPNPVGSKRRCSLALRPPES